jgi:hypothetical protein
MHKLVSIHYRTQNLSTEFATVTFLPSGVMIDIYLSENIYK